MKYATECNKILEEATEIVTKQVEKAGTLKDFEISKAE